jgi:hypothetical protein
MIAAAFGELEIVLSNVALMTRPALAADEVDSVPAPAELTGASLGATDIAVIVEAPRSPACVT